MGKDILCPYCYKHFNNKDIMVECENNSTKVGGDLVCKKEINSSYSQHWGRQLETHHIFRPQLGFFSFLTGYKPKPEKCDRCGGTSQRFVCPHCNNWLPKEMVEKGAEIISVIGGPASGKTNYIVTLIQQLKKYGNKLGLSITPQQVGRNRDDYTSRKYEAARANIFDEKMPVPKTQVTKYEIPWIFRLESHNTGKAVYLVFYDTAGENFKDADSIRKNAEYLRESKAVICVLDTLSVKAIKKVLESNNIENNDIATPFDETLEAIFNFQTSDTSLVDKPFAFTFSKFDAILQHKDDLAGEVDTFVNADGSPINSNFIKTGRFDLKQIKDGHNAIKSYMEDPDLWDQSQNCFDILEKWKDNACFFGVSAFGCMPNDDTSLPGDSDGEIKPYRVMDPLVWALYKVGGFFNEK